ncbi:hypothetical protein THAOC_11709 [Thalassiosira oceanica]|uniref:Uncharacterized protein n=1 Tax=Thalassiosira oceanica TaxID=159749 RepID=K0T200_THAOC|nr:hypothetical protein THAOC_11709 [Thalassiosira oceanica]|eukprot:EJK67276.1 hypothetical protein THAOC_11709 [Thalassiosira oceanica]
MWPFVNAAPQPSAAPRPLSQRSDRARARATVSAQDVANDFVENAGTATYTPDDGAPGPACCPATASQGAAPRNDHRVQRGRSAHAAGMRMRLFHGYHDTA